MKRSFARALGALPLLAAASGLAQASGIVSLETAAVTVNEQASWHSIKVLRSGGHTGSVSVDYETADGTATSATDYVATRGVLTFADGETEKVITVQIANEPAAEYEAAETFTLGISGPAASGITTTVFTINDTPTLTAIATQGTAIGTATAAIPFTMADPETPAADLVASATSGNPVLLPDTGIQLAGSGAERSLTLTPVAGLAGTAQVVLQVTDPLGAVAVRSFNLNVGPTAAAPVALPAALPENIVLTADDSFTLGYTLADASWVTSVSRSNTTLFNNPGTGSTSDLRTQPASGSTARTLRIRPKDNSTAAGLYGLSTVTLGFTGTGAPAPQTFNVRVNPRAVADNNLLAIPGTTSTFDVLANDVTPNDGHSFAITQVSTPANGTLVIAPDGRSLRYTPTRAGATSDTFTYTVTVSSADLFNGYQFTGIAYVRIGGYIVVDSATSSQHIDLDFDYRDGIWRQIIRTDALVGGSVQSGTFSPSIFDADEGILFFDPSTRIPRPDGTLFDAIGVPAGSDVWFGPTNGSGNKLFLGIASESTSGTEAYTPVGDPRATANARWVATRLVGFSGPGHFAAFIGGSVAFDTFDGLNTPDDSASGGNVSDTFWGFTGSHAHPAWYFTAPGNYTLTFQTTVKAGGEFVTSPPTTYHVAVDTLAGNLRLDENPPLARPDLLTAARNGGTVGVDVIANDTSEADGCEDLFLTDVGAAGHGVAAALGDARSVSYKPHPGFSGEDSFTYTVTDEHGGTATGTVFVTVGEGPAPDTGGPGARFARLPGGGAAITYQGAAGHVYHIERSTDLRAWTRLASRIAPLGGLVEYTDSEPPEPAAFYRVVNP